MKRTDITRRDILLFILKLSVTGILLAFCLSWIDVGDVLSALTAADPWLLLLALIFATLGTIILPAVVTRVALGIARIDLSLRELVAINFSIRFYVIILPRVMSLGIRWMRYGKGAFSSDALALLGFERIVYLATMFVCAVLAASVEYPRLGSWAPVVWLTAFAGATVLIMLLLPFLFGPAAQVLTWIGRLSEKFLPQFAAGRLQRLVEAVTAFRSLRGRPTYIIFCLSVMSVLFFVLSAYVVAGALGLGIGFFALVWVRPLVFAMTLFPISIGGVGLREVGFVGLLAIYGISAADAIAFSLTNFGLQLAIAAIGALLEANRLVQGLAKPTRAAQTKKENGN